MSELDSLPAGDVQKLAEEIYGFVPNLIREIGEHNPAAATFYLATTRLTREGTLSGPEREAILLAASHRNECPYDSSTHRKRGMAVGLSHETVEAIERGRLPSPDRLRALVQATRLTIDKRGWLDEDDLESLRKRGVDRAELYEINALIGLKTFSNAVNHVAQTEVDPAFE